jgi:pimeloyl-ACP methyl ester carboxylesterase
MQTVTSKDGTTIAFDILGTGPAVILIEGALCSRASWSGPELAKLLAPRFTVYNYDRRGRGDSGDTKPYAVEREIEDIEALIDAAGGSASLYGHSSGASLALEATLALGTKVTALAMYEAPYDDDPEAQRPWQEYLQRLSAALADNRRSEAAALFLRYLGMPNDQIERVRQSSAWPSLEAIAPTLAYDHAGVLGEDRSVPTEKAARIRVPTLVMYGDASLAFMPKTARSLSTAIQGAQLRALEGQTHAVSSEVLAPVLVEFFSEAPHHGTERTEQ